MNTCIQQSGSYAIMVSPLINHFQPFTLSTGCLLSHLMHWSSFECTMYAAGVRSRQHLLKFYILTHAYNTHRMLCYFSISFDYLKPFQPFTSSTVFMPSDIVIFCILMGFIAFWNSYIHLQVVCLLILCTRAHLNVCSSCKKWTAFTEILHINKTKRIRHTKK